MNRKLFFKEIESNIQKHGHHITMVSGGQIPRYAYTIGLTKTRKVELVLAGGIAYLQKEVFDILNGIAEKIVDSNKLENEIFTLDSLGAFRLRKVDSSWSKIILLGVFDYFEIDHVNAYQIVPDLDNITIDVPNMSKEYNENLEPAWKFLTDKWQYNIPEKTTVITNLDVLKGISVKEVMRWEELEWEMFSSDGTEIDKEEIRVVPIGILFNTDKSLLSALKLEVGKGMWRKEKTEDWQDWG